MGSIIYPIYDSPGRVGVMELETPRLVRNVSVTGNSHEFGGGVVFILTSPFIYFSNYGCLTTEYQSPLAKSKLAAVYRRHIHVLCHLLENAHMANSSATVF